MNNKGKIYFVGAGPGDPELITVKGLRIIEQADLIIYACSLVPASIFEKSRAETIIDSSGLTLEENHALMVSAYAQEKLVARLHTGDPSIFGTIHEQMELLQNAGIPFEIIPGVTAAFAAAASAKISFTLPEVCQTLIITRSPGRTRVPESQELSRLGATRSSMAVYLSAQMAEDVEKSLLESGLEKNTPVIIGWKVGWKDELVIQTSLASLSRTIRKNKIKGQAVFLILPERENAPRSRLYDPGFTHGFRGS